MKQLLQYPRDNITGKTYGNLTVLSFDGYNKNYGNKRLPYWLCACSCGNNKSVAANSLKTGAIQSCGCLLANFRKYELADMIRKKFSLPKGVAAFNRLYDNYRYRAVNKCKVSFDLTKDQFKALTKLPCKYCGSKPNHSIKSHTGSTGCYIYNGIDRIDNTLGYTSVNSVTCCEICNKAKRDMPHNEFIKWINKLVKFQSR